MPPAVWWDRRRLIGGSESLTAVSRSPDPARHGVYQVWVATSHPPPRRPESARPGRSLPGPCGRPAPARRRLKIRLSRPSRSEPARPGRPVSSVSAAQPQCSNDSTFAESAPVMKRGAASAADRSVTWRLLSLGVGFLRTADGSAAAAAVPSRFRSIRVPLAGGQPSAKVTWGPGAGPPARRTGLERSLSGDP